MDTLTPAPPIAPKRVALAEHPKHRRLLVVCVIVAAVVVIAATLASAALANYEPVTVDTTAVGVRPPSLVTDRFNANAPGGEMFTELHIGVVRGDRVTYSFWLHNDGPLAVTVTDVGRGFGAVVRTVGVRMGPAVGSDPPTYALPYTIAPHGYANLEVTVEVRKCIPGASAIGIGMTPVAYTTLDLFHHDTVIVMPMDLEFENAGTPCG